MLCSRIADRRFVDRQINPQGEQKLHKRTKKAMAHEACVIWSFLIFLISSNGTPKIQKYRQA